MRPLDDILRESSTYHSHLCPRQILGARMGLYAAELLGLALPRKDKRLLAISEIDGCFVDGISAATGCTLGHRTLRIEDYGKVAATFANITTAKAIRLAPQREIRRQAFAFAPGESRRYFAQLYAYQVMLNDELLSIQEVKLNTSLEEIFSRPGVRVNCDVCGEEIMNEREILQNGLTLCRMCAEGGYYQSVTKYVLKNESVNLFPHET